MNTPPAATVDGSGHQTVTGTIISGNAVINNSSFAYSLGCDLSVDNGIFGAVVTYNVPASSG